MAFGEELGRPLSVKGGRMRDRPGRGSIARPVDLLAELPVGGA
jgi:hypothetical protein